MIDPYDVPPVADDELLARFILNGNEFRADHSVTPKLFMPYQRTALSVNRHRDATIDETWQVGRDVAAKGQGALRPIGHRDTCVPHRFSLRG